MDSELLAPGEAEDDARLDELRERFAAAGEDDFEARASALIAWALEGTDGIMVSDTTL